MTDSREERVARAIWLAVENRARVAMGLAQTDEIPDYANWSKFLVEARAAIAALELSPDVSRESEWRNLADDLQQAEAEYRLMHDRHGDGSQAAGRAWDLLRRAGDEARAAFTDPPKATTEG